MTFDELNVEEFIKDRETLSVPKLAKKYDVHIRTISLWINNLKLPSKLFNWEHFNNYKLTKKQEEIILGSLLGDASLTIRRSKHQNSALVEKHGPKQKDYAIWKFNNFLPLPHYYSEEDTSDIYKNGIKKYVRISSHIVKTICHPIFTELDKKWYKHDENGNYLYKIINDKKFRIKTIPEDLVLTPLMIAIWFLDDGTNSQNDRYIRLATLCFTMQEVTRLSEGLKQLGIDNKIHETKEKQFYISVSGKNYFVFMKMVNEVISELPECMRYKFQTETNNSKLNITDEQEKIILKEVENGMSQIDISKKYNMSKKAICLLLRSKKTNNLHHRNTSGEQGVSIHDGQYYVSIYLNKKSLTLGSYKDKKDAAAVSEKAYHMRDVEQIKDVLKYKEMVKDYRRKISLEEISQRL